MKDSIIDSISIIVLAVVLVSDVLWRNQFSGGILLFIIGAVVIIFGMMIWIIGKITLGEYFTSSVSPKGLVTKGIYAKIRHPLYCGGIMIYIGVSLLFRSWIGLILAIFLVTPMLIYFAKKEEELLYERYQEKYSDYKRK